MAMGATCIPTIREEVVRLHEADRLHGAELGMLANEARRRSAQKTSAGRAPLATHARPHGHWPLRAAHTH